MSDNPSIDPGTSPTLPIEGDDVGGGVVRQGVVVAWGAKDASVRVSAAAPMPVVQTGTPALPTGAAADATLTANGVLVGPVTETAPATDTASSGLNGRLQRIAQRLSTIIGVLPTALGANGGLKIEGVASGTAVPVSNASLPLPAGAATETTLAAVNTKLGSALPLPTGASTEATLSTASGTLTSQNALYGAVTETAPASDTASSGLNGRLQRVAQRMTSLISLMPASIGQKTSTASLAVVVASDQSAIAVTTTPPANASTNLAQVAGASTAVGHGTAATALRVELPTDGTGVVGLAAGAATIGSLAANQSVNNAQINGVTPLMGNGASGTGAQRVTIASDSTGQITLAAGAAAIGSVTANIGTSGSLALDATLTGGTQKTKIVDTGGTTAAVVKAASTAAVATDPALVVTVSPNTPLPAGTAIIGALSANQSVNQAQVAGTATSVNSGTVDAGTQRVADAGSNTGTLSNVAASVTSVTVLASNTARRGATVWNDSTSILYLKFGTTASATSATVKMVADAYYEVPANYNGRIDGIWVTAAGSARVTEITA